MNTQAVKNKNGESKPLTNLATPTRGASKSAVQLVEKSTEARTQERLNMTASNSQQVARAIQLQATADHYASKQRYSVLDQGQGVIQPKVKSRIMGKQDTQEHSDMDSICSTFNITKLQLRTALTTKLFVGDLVPDKYKQQYDNGTFREEVESIIDKLIKNSQNANQIVANDKDVAQVGNQLYAIISGDINRQYLEQFPNYNIMKNLGDEDAGKYDSLINEMLVKLSTYKGEIHMDRYDEDSRKKNERMQHRISSLKTDLRNLKNELDTAIKGQNDTAPTIKKIQMLRQKITDFEKAWDLDWKEGDMNLDAKINTLKQADGNPGTHYQDDGGVDDEQSVSDEYQSSLACSIFAILKIKGGSWLGSDKPKDIHNILRKTQKLKDYDENQIAAKVRHLAGLSPTKIGGKTLNKHLEDRGGNHSSFIVDVKESAHTFTVFWNGAEYKRADETGSNVPIGDYGTEELLWSWQ